MASRASPRLYYIRQIKRKGLTRDELLVYYKTMIRRILEHSCPVWHSGLTFGESDLLDQTPKTSTQNYLPGSTIYRISRSAHLELLGVQRERLSKQFFRNMCKPDSKYYLLEKKIPHITQKTLQHITVQYKKKLTLQR